MIGSDMSCCAPVQSVITCVKSEKFGKLISSIFTWKTSTARGSLHPPAEARGTKIRLHKGITASSLRRAFMEVAALDSHANPLHFIQASPCTVYSSSSTLDLFRRWKRQRRHSHTVHWCTHHYLQMTMTVTEEFIFIFLWWIQCLCAMEMEI